MTAGLTAAGVLIPPAASAWWATSSPCPGPPDLVPELLAEVGAPTLLVAGGADTAVLEINRRALGRLGGPCHLHIVPGATHLFPEPGALDTVAAVARDWVLAHLGARAVPNKEA